MPTRNPSVNVVLEKPDYDIVEQIAREEGASLSTVVRNLVKEAVEIREDIGLTPLATDRERTLPRRGALSHKEVWG
ncbi:MAG TPA: hypothetical protein VER06_00235 [Candidatus Methanoperedens sp.]|nr:hypothetical protein [Candidatus Methanoperedens sp.]